MTWRPLALALLTAASALAADEKRISVVSEHEGVVVECADLVLTGYTDEEAETLRSSGRPIASNCAAEAERLKLQAMGVCKFPKVSKEGKSLAGSAWYYTPTATFGDGGFKSQCLESKGAWKSTPAGTKAEVKVKADAAEAKRLAALPKAAAEEVAYDYDANEVAADAKYKGKVFLVTGQVQSVKKDAGGRIYIQASGGNPYIGVHLFVKDAAFASELEPGAFVEIECTGTGQGLLMAPSFTCR
jgi:hypothetical protein